jgi:hypothetical protein
LKVGIPVKVNADSGGKANSFVACRNGVWLQTEIAFIFDRIPQKGRGFSRVPAARRFSRMAEWNPRRSGPLRILVLASERTRSFLRHGYMKQALRIVINRIPDDHKWYIDHLSLTRLPQT